MVDISLLQSLSYVAAAIGVCVAAFYYVSMIRNAEREKRRQTILQKLPAMSKEYYDCYLQLRMLRDWTTPIEYIQKHAQDAEVPSKVFYVMNIYNTVGVLYQEGLMSLEDIAQLYTPVGIIGMWERFEFMIPNNRLNSSGEPSFPEFWVPLERLYKAMKARYPGVEGFTRTPEEDLERRRRREVNVYSKRAP